MKRTNLSLALLGALSCCSGCGDVSDAFPSPGRTARIYTGFGLPREDVLCFQSHREATGLMQASMLVNDASTEEWYWKLPPEDRARIKESYRSRKIQDEMFAEGHWVLIPYDTRCVVLEDENNGRGEGSPYKVKILDGPRRGETWWVHGFQLDLEETKMTPAEVADIRPSDKKTSTTAEESSSTDSKLAIATRDKAGWDDFERLMDLTQPGWDKAPGVVKQKQVIEMQKQFSDEIEGMEFAEVLKKIHGLQCTICGCLLQTHFLSICQ